LVPLRSCDTYIPVVFLIYRIVCFVYVDADDVDGDDVLVEVVGVQIGAFLGPVRDLVGELDVVMAE